MDGNNRGEFMKNSDCTILVTGCMAYQDVLTNFEYFFQKFWRDCPFPIILNIDGKIETDFPYDQIVVSPHKENLIRMRDVNISSPYVIMMQDDHLLFDHVDTDKILQCIEYAKKYNCGNLRLMQDPIATDIFSDSENLLEYKPGKAYRISARGGLWKTEYFKIFIDNFDDLWQMERHGQELSCQYEEKVLCTKFRTLPIIDAVHKGYYEDFAAFLLDANAITPTRAVMSNRQKAIEHFKGAIIDWNPELVTGIQTKLNLGYKPKYK